MTPLIRIQPTKDGGRRMLTDEAKATFAAWLKMVQERWERQWNQMHPKEPYPWDHTTRRGMDSLAKKCEVIDQLIRYLDCTFESDRFAATFEWALEVMNGKPDDPAGGSTTGDAVGPSTSPA